MRYIYSVLIFGFLFFGFSRASGAQEVPPQKAEASSPTTVKQPSLSNAQVSPAVQTSSESFTSKSSNTASQLTPKLPKAEEKSVVPAGKPKTEVKVSENDYKLGVDDVLEISILQPDKMELVVTVSPDGTFTFPYIGKVEAKGKTGAQIQDEIQTRLADGYLKYPVVSVALKQSFSKKFSVYGEVAKPGTYLLEDKSTVLKAISLAGGLTKYGSTSRVKILRPKKESAGYDVIKADIKSIMNGQGQDVLLQAGDIVQVDEGMF